MDFVAVLDDVGESRRVGNADDMFGNRCRLEDGEPLEELLPFDVKEDPFWPCLEETEVPKKDNIYRSFIFD